MTDFFNGIQRQFKVDVDFFEESNYAQHYDDILEKIRVIIEEYLPTDATSILGSLSSLVTKQNNELSKRLNHSYTSDKYSIYTIRSENFQKLVQLVKDTTDYDDQLKIPVTFQDFSDHTFYRDSLNRLIDSLAPELQDNPIVIKNRLLERVFSPELDEFLRVALWFQIQKFDELNWTIDKESADELLNLASNNADELRNRLKNHLEELQSLISFSNELVNDKNNFLQASLLSLQDKMICELTNPTAQSVEWAQEPFSSLIRNQLSSAIGNKIEELSLSEWETAINLKLTDEEQPRVNQTDSNPPKSSESSPGFFKRHRYAILALAIIGLVITAGVLMASGVMAPLGLTFLVGLILGTTLSALGLLSGGIALFKMARDELVHRDDARRQKEPQDLPNPIVPQHENEFELTRAQRFAQHQYEYEKQFHADYAPFYQQVMARAYDIEDKQDPVLSSSKPIPQASGSNGISISGSGFSFYDHTHDKERGAETSIPSSVLNKTSGLGPTNSHFI
jgi:Txe/YoeB family toxin of Txe-Axe toxin-antitoxin module